MESAKIVKAEIFYGVGTGEIFIFFFAFPEYIKHGFVNGMVCIEVILIIEMF